MKPFYVYMLRCNDGAYYVGHTDDLETRIAQHGDGTLGGYTSGRRPVELVWCTELATRDEALQREQQVKRWSRAKKEALIRADWRGLKCLSRGADRVTVHPSTTCEPGGSHYARDERIAAGVGDERSADGRMAAGARDERSADGRMAAGARDERSADGRIAAVTEVTGA